MREAIPSPEHLTVLIGGQSVGTVIVRERYLRKVFGVFTPSAEFEPYRQRFEKAVDLARQFDALLAIEPCDDMLWARLMAAYAEINDLKPVFAELPAPIEEFAIDSDWSVEVTFEVTAAEPDASADRR